MKVEQIYTGCLAQGAYYIVSEGEAVIIDPLREVQPYLNKLQEDKATLKYIFETHFHADFVSGHLDLSEKTGAGIVYGPTAKPEFEAVIAKDEEVFEIGKVKIKVLHTPGHTLESSCYLLIDEDGKETALFSGDTLFLGDVGRPDLAQKGKDLTQEDLAGMLYESLMNKIMPLSDDITVYPAHGAGSACGKNMQKETVDSLGNQKRTNYALNQPDKAAFVQEVTDGLTPPPGYFAMNVAMNKKGYESFDHVLLQGSRSLSPEEFEKVAEETGALILDTRPNETFVKSFIPQSVNIALNGDFAPWVGTLIADVKQSILLVTDEGTTEEAITRLSRVGFDHVVGYLKGGVAAWQEAGKETDNIHRITAEEFAQNYTPESKIIDVRKEGEYSAEHVEDAYSRPLAYINNWIKDIDPKEHFFLHCAGGYRSMIAASILQARGYRNFTEIEGGFKAVKTTIIPVTDFVCQSKI
ncbi:MBL fold metallo-hydrolase [Elizabethkingia meningoseptica]|uniref:MBL fold metallo-hydrolase n=4 Tax=Elizabethkingia meningoseptica TaxID=238 RepID=UPI000332D0D9|nr:MBL fold metallo-hydrolase [Elizabethkingia meningoseptica]AQX06774.1 MBL fold metallo-hydrolase [Elizabethkingia meningoseptica]AQX48821.1 MBL fold metallo-hydrolase [Elizabethkingia meningoseptica]EOR29896.1 rhodanese domain-containing protein [Elizabethkingia meningoseptica ATCC 13253 = NBRC 12535]KUY14907.1 MBL fold metallo-hydrolase [Elizabethkingia meningoseptica]MDE5488348.1 MBL fold metallo-hydrolase [Elizabethkingia meningoseptica]